MRIFIWSLVFLICAVFTVAGFFYLSDKMKSLGSERILSVLEMEQKGLSDFEFTDIDSRSHRLSDYKGKVVILNFWASWCAPCLEEFPSMVKLINEFPKDVVLVALSQDKNRQDIDSFLKVFPDVRKAVASGQLIVVHDQEGVVGRQYAIEALPESFIADKELKLAKKILGSVEWYNPESIAYMRSLFEKRNP